MEKPPFPRRFFTKGLEPDTDKSIGYYSSDTKLFEALDKLLSDDEWNELESSPLGVFFKFIKMKFSWASMVVKCMLSMQIVCSKPFEIWSVVGASPVRFSLHEFAHITGLNCDYKEKLETPETAEDSDDEGVFWEKLGVNVNTGPTIDNLTRACGWAQDWSREDRKRLAYLAVYAGFIVARRPSIATPVEMAKLVMDLEEFEGYPWGRVAFYNVIRSVKSVNLTKNYYIDGFAEVLQLWVYFAMPSFGQDFGFPILGSQSPPMLAFKGSKGRKNIMENLLAQVNFNHMVMRAREDAYPMWDNDVEDEHVDNVIKALYGELGGRWRWKPSDWVSKGVVVWDNVKAEKATGKKRLLDPDSGGKWSGKRPCPDYGTKGQSSDAGLEILKSAMQAMFDQFTKQQSREQKIRFDRLDEKIELINNKIEKLRGGTSEDTEAKEHVKSNDGDPEGNDDLKSNAAEDLAPAVPSVSKDPSRKHSARIAAKQNVVKPVKLENHKPSSSKPSKSRASTKNQKK